MVRNWAGWCVLVCFAALCAQAAPMRVDWEDGQWKHGVTDYTGYQQPTIVPGVGVPYSATTLSGGVTVDWTRFGTATGVHSGIGGIQPRVSALFAGAGTDGAISLGTSGDSNSAALTNYVALRIAFTQAVNVLPFVIGDVDRTSPTGTDWEDFIAVTALDGAAPVAVSYTTSPAANTLHTRFSLSGVLGTRNVANNEEGANVTVNPSGPVTSLMIYFFQGPNGIGGSAHGVWMRDIEYNPAKEVPEPGALTLGAAPWAYFFLRARRKNRETPHR